MKGSLRAQHELQCDFVTATEKKVLSLLCSYRDVLLLLRYESSASCNKIIRGNGLHRCETLEQEGLS